MTSFFCISIRFLQPYSHARCENGDPEWPISPLRVFQALVAASAGHWNEKRELDYAQSALKWLEALPNPKIIAPKGIPSKIPCQFYVPDNTADLLVSAWKKGEITKQPKRTEKLIRPNHLDDEAIHYLYPLSDNPCSHVDTLIKAARSITHLGWGIDMVVGDAKIITEKQAADLSGHHWQPTSIGGTPLRTSKAGTLDDLTRKHKDFLDRMTNDGFHPVPPLRAFNVTGYRHQDHSLQRPYQIFELRNINGSRHRYPHSRLIHISGMVRHLAIKAMKKSPPRGVGENWVRTYIAGHATKGVSGHHQLSYLPLPSLGHEHADPGVRRVMIMAPLGDDQLLDHVVRRIGGCALEPHGHEFGDQDPPLLVPVKHDNIANFYTKPGKVWHSFTPVILPGHDDHNPDKRRSLIKKALVQAGIDQSCEFEASAFSYFRKSYSAHKYDKEKRLQGYIRPDYLLSQTAVHLTLRFEEEVPGPIVIGAGRHCGLGLFAPTPI